MIPYVFQELFLVINTEKPSWRESQLCTEGLALPGNHNGVWPTGLFLPNPPFHFTFARLQLRVPDNSA